MRAVRERLFVRSGTVGTRGAQPLSYGLRLPDEAQADALRLLDASRAIVNATLTQLWPSLDSFASDRAGPAYKQVGQHMGSPDPHGDRQWRCESETAGRILRAHAERKQAFTLIQPILTHGFIRPNTDRKPAGKNRRAIRDALNALKQIQEDVAGDPEGGETAFVTLQNVVEQACNYYLEHDRFPATYEELQPIPVLSAGVLTYAGDDGSEKGQAYRLRLDADAGVAFFRFRCPDEQGVWGWRAGEARISLPTCVQERLRKGELLAPTLREVRRANGERYAVLDLPVAVPVAEPVVWETVERVLGVDWGVHTLLTATAIAVPDETTDPPGNQQGTHAAPWRQVGRPFFLNTGGFDGRQARTRRQIDQLQAKRDRVQQERETLAQDYPKQAWYTQRIRAYDQEIARCWRKYDLRNRTLAHLAANVLLLLSQIHGCSFVAVESLKTLKTTGRGKGVRGRWRNYRNNTTLRGEIWRVLRYKCFLAGVRRHTARPKDTSHTCPRCGAPAQTYRSPSDRQRGEAAIEWGRWLWCAACGYNGDRDYCASLNIARLGTAFLVARQQTGVGRAVAVRDPSIKPVSYTGAGSALLLPPTGRAPARPVRGKICYLPGWLASAFLQSSQPKAVFLRLCG
jgi:putative transposase